MLDIQNLQVVYGTGRLRVDAVKNVSFHVEPGAAYGLVGESGSGKSTVLRAICGLAPISGGRVLVVEMLVPEEVRPDFVMLMDLNMLVMTGGRERTAREFEKVFHDAGFAMTRVIPTKSPFALIEARPR